MKIYYCDCSGEYEFMNGQLEETRKFTIIDSYGSFKIASTFSPWNWYYGNFYKAEYNTEIEACFNQYGLLSNYISISNSYDHRTQESSSETESKLIEIIYDDQFGYPKEYIIEDKRYVFSDYKDLSSVKMKKYDVPKQEELFTINGIRATKHNMNPGIYIKRNGNTVKKIRIK